MANLYKYNIDTEEFDRKNYEIKERDGKQFAIWQEDLDLIVLSKSQIAELAKAMGYTLVKTPLALEMLDKALDNMTTT